MSAVKRKLNNALIQKCKIIRHIEKGMTNNAPMSGRHKFQFFAIFSLSRTFSISNKLSGPLRVQDRESPLYAQNDVRGN